MYADRGRHVRLFLNLNLNLNLNFPPYPALNRALYRKPYGKPYPMLYRWLYSFMYRWLYDLVYLAPYLWLQPRGQRVGRLLHVKMHLLSQIRPCSPYKHVRTDASGNPPFEAAGHRT